VNLKVNVILRLTVSRPVSPAFRFIFPIFFKYVFSYYDFVDLGRSLCREVGSVDYGCWRASPVQSLLGLRPSGHMTIFYCLNLQTPKLRSVRSDMKRRLQQDLYCSYLPDPEEHISTADTTQRKMQTVGPQLGASSGIWRYANSQLTCLSHRYISAVINGLWNTNRFSFNYDLVKVQ
jgi:hypothetical protein